MAHIVLDVRIIETSTGRYMQRLLEELNDTYSSDGHHYTALIPSPHIKKWQDRLPHIRVVASDAKWYTFSEQWSFYWQLKHLKPDLVHFTMPQQPLLWTGPAVTTIHDMTLLRFENIDASDNPWIYKFKKRVLHALMWAVMRRARAIITPTHFVREDLGRFFGERYLPIIYVTHEAGEIPSVAPEPMTEFVGSSYICTLGNMFPYKNVQRVIDAFAKLTSHHRDLHLLCIGKKDEFALELEKQVIDRHIPRVHFLGFISDGQKRWVLQHAEAYVSASLSEGFCIPVLEAMVEGCPTILANASCLPETGGTAAIYFDPYSTDECAAAIESVITDKAKQQAMAEAGRRHVQTFSWQKMVSETHQIYLDSLEKFTTNAER